MKQKNYQRWSRPLLSVFMAFSGANSAWADAYTTGFETADGWTTSLNALTAYAEGWGYKGGISQYYRQATSPVRSGTYSLYYLQNGGTNASDYIITPKLKAGTITFYARVSTQASANKVVCYPCSKDGEVYTVSTASNYLTKQNDDITTGGKSGTNWTECTFDLAEDAYVAIYLNKVYIDDFVAANGIVEEGLPKPTAFTTTATTYNSATFSWTAGGTETAWQIAYDTDTDFDKDRVTPAPTDITAAELVEGKYTLTDLSENTTYYAYLRAKSGEEVSSWTNKISFITPAQYPAPTALASSGETTSAATISWTAGSSETAWELSYSVNSDFSASIEVTTDATSKELTGLTANTTYYVKVRANYGGDNYSAWTDAITFKTLQVATDASNYSDDFETSNNWNLINGTQTNAWAWGTAAKKDGSKGLYVSNDGGTTNAYSGSSTVYASQLFSFAAGDYIVSYDWLCKGEKSAWGEASYDYLRVFLVPAATELTAGSGSFSYSGQPTGWISIDDGAALVNESTWQHKSVNISIPSNTNYNVVFAWTSDGSGGDNPPAAIDNFAIRLNDTPNPTSLAVTDITAHAGTLGWTSTDNTWEVYHSTSSATPAVDQTPTASPNTNSYTFTGLDAETKYYVWVRSVSKTNASWKSDWVGTNFTTEVAAVAPTGLTASSITATGATLSWTAGADETKWDLVYGTVNDAESLSNTKEEINTTPTKVLTGLTAETTYYAFVRAKKGEEVSSWVNISFFPTATVQLTVNDGEATNQYVINGYYCDNYQKTEYIIPKTDLTTVDGGVIKSMRLYISTPANKAFTSTFKVFLKETENTTIDSYEGYVDGDVVYTGTFDATGSVLDIVFDDDYEYNGGNLLVGIYNTTKGVYTSSGTPKFYGKSSTGSLVSGYNSVLASVSATQQNFLPKTTFTYLPVTGAKMQINKTAIDFGSVTSLPQNETFTISNSKGIADLTHIAVAITGTNAAAYSVSALPRTTITTTGETAADIELTVTFDPAAGGTYNDATITINADDQDEKTIALTGTYVANPVMGVFNDVDATDAATTGETINFGYAEEAPVYTYYIKNTGAGTLDVAVTNGGFTVSPAEVSLAAGAKQAFTITPNVANADATVTFTGKNHDGGAAIGTFTVTLQGTVMPLTTTFFEGFNYATGDATPDATTTELDGWEINNPDGVDKTIKFYQGKIYYYASSTETANVVTPKLRVSGTSDELRISAYTAYTYASSKLIISYSADKTNWVVAATKTGKSDFDGNTYTLKDFVISGIPEGSYYFKIEMCDVAVNHFYGFSTSHPAAVALNESSTPSLEDNVVRDVTLTRNFIAGWNTICLPFAVAASDMESKFGAGVKLYDCTGFSENVLSFEQVNTGIVAGKPYLIYVANAIADPITFWNATISATAPVNTVLSGVTFHGTFAPIAAGGVLTGKYGISKVGRIAKANSATHMNGFRGYLEGELSSARISIFDETTGISRIYDANEVFGKDAKVYNLSGQKVENAKKGVYIVNGRKVVVK